MLCNPVTTLLISLSRAIHLRRLAHLTNLHASRLCLQHFMVCHIRDHMSVDHPFLLLVCIHQRFLANAVDHSRYPSGHPVYLIFSITGEEFTCVSCIIQMRSYIFAHLGSVESPEDDAYVYSLPYLTTSGHFCGKFSTSGFLR